MTSRVLVALRIAAPPSRVFEAFTAEIGEWRRPNPLFPFWPIAPRVLRACIGDGIYRAAGECSRASGLRPGPTSALCGRVPHMEETRTEKISVNLTPSVLARLDDMRARRRWTRSTAAAVLIEHGLDSEDRMTALAGQATTSQEYTALTQENLGADGKER